MKDGFAQLQTAIEHIYQNMKSAEQKAGKIIASVHPKQKRSITNLIHYHAAQAECVMLNKGKYLLTVLATLQDILHRSGGHHAKKRYVFRPLKIAERFLKNL